MKGCFWFRKDLRLADNPALNAAIEACDEIVLLYFHEDEASSRPLGGAQRWWLHHSLMALMRSLKTKKATLTLLRGDVVKTLPAFLQANSIDALFCNKNYEPTGLVRDQTLSQHLDQIGISMQQYHDQLLLPPDAIKNKQGGQYKVYTPYAKALKGTVSSVNLQPVPDVIPHVAKIKADNLDDWQLLPRKPDWSQGFSDWAVGENAAEEKLAQFIEDAIENYHTDRDRPDIHGTSQLSPHIHFGEISVRRIWHVVSHAQATSPHAHDGMETYLKQIIWREFSYYQLHHFPQLASENYHRQFNQFPWRDDPSQLQAWQKGLTGYPIVDAGMRQLWHTGYMHNRVRMIVASFLTKHCLIHWQEGEAWFWDTLVDADIANNAASWQWVAGCGADAAPYFRIFNPIIQGEKFDPNGEYIKRWCPELADVPKKYLYLPADAPDDVLAAAGVVLGKHYPRPIVEHAKARERALASYQKIKAS